MNKGYSFVVRKKIVTLHADENEEKLDHTFFTVGNVK